MAMKKMLSVLFAILIVQSHAGTVDTSDIEGWEMFPPEERKESPTTVKHIKEANDFDVVRATRLLEFPERLNVVKPNNWVTFYHRTMFRSFEKKSPCAKSRALVPLNR